MRFRSGFTHCERPNPHFKATWGLALVLDGKCILLFGKYEHFEKRCGCSLARPRGQKTPQTAEKVTFRPLFWIVFYVSGLQHICFVVLSAFGARLSAGKVGARENGPVFIVHFLAGTHFGRGNFKVSAASLHSAQNIFIL